MHGRRGFGLRAAFKAVSAVIPAVFVAVFIAAAAKKVNVFSSFGKFQIRQALPNFGVGLRVELKHNVNGRIDFGFGKGTSGFVFAIGEAF